MKNLKKSLMFFVTVVTLMMVTTITTFASEPTYSANWYQESNGTWKIKDSNGATVKNAWLCDDVVPANGKNVWYLLDAGGNMISAGLVQDGTGNYYSLETNHDGYYGMLRYKSGIYDGIYLELESSHNGSFAAIKNADGIEALKAKYGLTKVSINNDNCVYTSSFTSSQTSSTPNVSVGVAPTSSDNGISQADFDTWVAAMIAAGWYHEVVIEGDMGLRYTRDYFEKIDRQVNTTYHEKYRDVVYSYGKKSATRADGNGVASDITTLYNLINY